VVEAQDVCRIEPVLELTEAIEVCIATARASREVLKPLTQDATTPKLPPSLREAQNTSAFSPVDAVMASPSTITVNRSIAPSDTSISLLTTRVPRLSTRLQATTCSRCAAHGRCSSRDWTARAP
jgi:hypothetical protein